MGRPKVKEYKKSISLSINKELSDILDKIVEEKKVSKSKYIEYLIRKDKDKTL